MVKRLKIYSSSVYIYRLSEKSLTARHTVPGVGNLEEEKPGMATLDPITRLNEYSRGLAR
jgi:hypothetical protein